MAIDLAQFRATFFVEAAEHLAQMESALLQLEHSPGDVELLNTIFRAAHSIKGASNTFGMDDIGRFTHVLESLLEQLREGTIRPSGELIELLLSSVDVLQGLLSSAKDNTPTPESMDSILSRLKQIHHVATDAPGSSLPAPAVSTLAASSSPCVYQILFRPSKNFFRFGQDPLLILQELYTLGEVIEVQLDASELPTLANIDPESCYLRWKILISTSKSESELSDVFMFLDEESQFTVGLANALEAPTMDDQDTSDPLPALSEATAITPTVPPSALANPERRSGDERRVGPALPSENETVRVDRHRLDELINQIGELVIGASMVEQEVLSGSNTGASAAMLQLAKIVRDLQEMSLALRMVPIAATFQKMTRIVRDLSKKLNKQVVLTTEGEDTELDKSVVDQIGDPLVHMVRNAVDHGLEDSEHRIALGKPETGRVTLRAYQQGGNIFIDVEDDGKGLNRKAILAKAVERGLVGEGDTPTDAEICNFIFHPGFSTASMVTDVSGRGVGMDVVRRNVEALQGSITIRSIEGKGSTLTIRLPLTLAILDGLLVRLREEVYIIPLLSVVESIRVDSKQLRRIPGIGEVILLRGEVVPVVRLRSILQRDTAVDSLDHGLLVIVEDQGRRFAMMVDDLIGQQQVVIKNLETNLRKVPGVAGATILGDGRVALILDIYGVACLNAGDRPPATPSESKLDPNNTDSYDVAHNHLTTSSLSA